MTNRVFKIPSLVREHPSNNIECIYGKDEPLYITAKPLNSFIGSPYRIDFYNVRATTGVESLTNKKLKRINVQSFVREGSIDSEFMELLQNLSFGGYNVRFAHYEKLQES